MNELVFSLPEVARAQEQGEMPEGWELKPPSYVNQRLDLDKPSVLSGPPRSFEFPLSPFEMIDVQDRFRCADCGKYAAENDYLCWKCRDA